jgi:hypothetical protein
MATKVKLADRKKQPAVVVNDMTLVAPNRNAADIGKLKAAIERAESIAMPNRSQLYDIYRNITTIDGHLSGLIEKRISGILNKDLMFVNGKGRKLDGFDELITCGKFNDLIKLIIESKLWGVSGVEFIIGNEFDFVEVPRKHIRPESGVITMSQYSNSGLPVSELPFVWTVGEPRDLGKLLTCSMYSLYKISGFGDFAQYVEIFGQPVRIIYYDAYDSKTKEQLRDLLKNSGSSLAMMVPKQAQFQMLDGKTSNGTGDLQINFIQACNAEMSVAILGNTETTTSSRSSGYAQAKEQANQQLEITKTDLAFVENVLNDKKFLKILQSYGYPADKGAFQFKKEIDTAELAARLAIDGQVSLKVPLDDDYWYDTYGLPKPDNYDELKAQQEAERQKEPQRQADDAADKKPSENQKKSLFDRLADFFGQARQERAASSGLEF